MTIPSQFIANSDYATAKNDNEVTLSVETIFPLVLPAGYDNLVLSDEVTVGDNFSAGWRCILSSDNYNYSITTTDFEIECTTGGLPDTITGKVYRKDNKFILEIVYPAYSNRPVSYQGTEQKITAKIQSIIDPFVV